MTRPGRLLRWLLTLVALAVVAAAVGWVLPGRGLPVGDRPLLGFLAAHRSAGATDLFRVVTTVGAPGFALLASLVSAAVLLVRRAARAAALLAVAPLSADGVSVAVKVVVRRARPPVSDRVAHVSAHGYSFPSGHATVAAAACGALAVVLWQAVRRLAAVLAAALLALVAAGVGFSRLYLGVHWLSDVVAGWVVGAGCVAAATLALPRGGPDPPVLTR